MNINELKNKAFDELEKIKNPADLEQFKIKYFGRKSGELTAILKSLKDLSVEKRKVVGQKANQLKRDLERALEEKKRQIENWKLEIENSRIDITAPGKKIFHGHLHPITLTLRKIEDIFHSMGFKIIEGPDIETEYYNFDALNIPKDHPARDVWDTFWLRRSPEAKSESRPRRASGLEKLLLRTHTSPMQIRYMEKNNPPFRIIVPGRCFRYEAIDASHSHTFYQIEGLFVDRHISLSNMKAIIELFVKKFYGEDVKMRWQPSYFPFVEPGLELLLGCTVCDGKGCPACDGSGWVELIPCGMVHPNVFKSAGYVPGEWQGFAFGMGLDRIVMMKYRINDIRLLYSGDLKFLNQF